MTNARPRSLVRVLALLLLFAFTAGGRSAFADGPTGSGVTISNRAEATYTDDSGTGFATVSPVVTITVLTVAAVNTTPDETDPSATVAPNDRVTRLFRVCNTGNTPDFYTITSADVSAPAALVSLYFDADASGTLTSSDTQITLDSTMSPRLAHGQCVGVIAVVDTNGGQVGQQLSIRINARSSVTDALNAGAQDSGTIINIFGNGARLSSPTDPKLPPVKLVEGKDHVTSTSGQALSYTITFRNSGDIPATNVRVQDDLPDGLDYVAGTLRLDNRQLTDADDTDEGSVVARRIQLHLAQVAVGETVEVAFQARVSAGVAHGTGVVNNALVKADNAPAGATTTATAVVNPFGVVYEGRSAGTPIAGARVALLADSQGSASVSLDSSTGSDPNNANANPFASDTTGRFSFVLASAQLGTPQAPARYFLNVTAAGYRARLIETDITPSADNSGLFTLSVRALDGQPVAKDGSFETTDSAVDIAHLAAYALNVPMFENTTLEITKMADQPSVEIGDTVSYHVEIHNATAAAVDDAVVTDQLPPSFHYAEGTALLTAPPAPQQSITPQTSDGSTLVFHIGRVEAGARVTLVYRVRVGANAQEGDQYNSASAAGTLTTGERVSTPPARASVRVRRGIFSSQQVIIGRVFADANLNGQFDNGERGLPGVRLYLNNGQSVITDSEGLYNFPAVNEGAQVISLDPVTLPPGYTLVDTGRRDEKSWTRLLRTPLGGGAMLRQNFALRSPEGEAASVSLKQGGAASSSSRADGAASSSSTSKNSFAPNSSRGPLKGSLFGGADAATKNNESFEGGAVSVPSPNSNANGTNGSSAPDGNPNAPKKSAPLASGTYEMTTDETLEPVAPGDVRVLSPQPNETIAGASLEIAARTNGAWTVAVEVAGQRVPDSKIGEKRLDRKNDLATFTFVGLNVAPGPNRIKVTAIGPDGSQGKSVELVAYGRGPAKRLEIVTDKAELSAGGRDSTTVLVRAFDQWNHPAADGTVALAVSAGRLVRVDDNGAPVNPKAVDSKNSDGGVNINPNADVPAQAAGQGAQDAALTQQVVPLTGGEGRVLLVADNTVGATEIKATTGAVEAQHEVRVTPEVRSSILVGLAEVSIGSSAPALSGQASDATVRSRLAFFYRGQFLGSNLLTLAYDSNRPVNRTGGGDRLFQLDPLDRTYPLFGDSSTRYEDAQSDSKLYLRVDHKRSYFLFGDMETENRNAGLAAYTRKLTGVKLHLENSHGDYISVTGARPDTAFARDVFPGGALAFATLSHAEVLPGSETVVIEVRDRRNPEVILSRESLIRSVDYNLDASTGQMFFLRPISSFDFSFNLIQVVVTYEYQATGMSQAVYTARGFKNFEGLGLKVGMSFVDQREGEFGSFVLGGADLEKTLPRGGRVRVEWATSRGRVASGGNLFGASLDDRHDGNAYKVELEQPLAYRETRLRASYSRADEGFINPFGATVTPGSQRAEASVEMKVMKAARAKFSFIDERNHTSNVDNSRETASLQWTQSFGDRLRATFGYDFRDFKDDLAGKETRSNLVTVGAEYRATDKIELSAKREQNLGEADPTYPNQTTLAATYRWNQYTKLFFTERLADAPITPIGDVSATGFAATTARSETAIGVETKLGHFASLNSRYQIENGVNGTDSFAVIGLGNRLPINKQLSLDLGFERGFHLAGNGESFDAGHLGFAWQPVEGFRTTGRYELQDRNGFGSVLTLGAAGRLLDDVTTLARVQFSRTNFQGRDGSALSATAALAWRPLHTDAAGLLFSYTRRDITQSATQGQTLDRSDTLSSDGYYQASRNVELFGRFALKLGDNASPGLARVSTLTYLTQGRVAYRLGRYVDVAGEGRWLAQPSTSTARASFGTEMGFWVLPDLRVGGGYNWTEAIEPGLNPLVNARRGFYFTISSKLSNLFDLFGTPRQNAQAAGDPQTDAGAARPKHEDE
ncbi:MAG TPA: isopeptide-forming domain-containing fimbrial protein [Pyrinomonadaceae bacterium]|nr:isopeptide-forming domain-containing fimbrial protein [Pyrinomonadaceae bacterium]